MIVEYIEYQIPETHAEDFSRAWRAAREPLRRCGHVLSAEISQGLEQPRQWVVRIEWNSLSGHLEGFRRGVYHADYVSLVGPFDEFMTSHTHFKPRAEFGSEPEYLLSA